MIFENMPFKEWGYTDREAIDKIRNKYGTRVTIMSKKKINVRGLFGLFPREGVEYTGYVPDKRLLPEKEQDERNKQAILNMAGNPKAVKEFAQREKKEKSASIDDVLKEIQDLKQQVDGAAFQEKVLPSGLEHIKTLLEENDFSPRYIQNCLSRLKKEFSLEDLEQKEVVEQVVFQWISDSVKEGTNSASHKPRIFVLVGPTGVGKTTTIAKLAAIHHKASSSEQAVQSICLITIDNYRIGARSQLEAYGKIMKLPVFSAESYGDLKNIIKQNKNMDLILVDTIGKSPRDFMKLSEMRSIVEACGEGAEIHLAISATTKNKDMEEILIQFEPFNYSSLILTKLDETTRVGNLISIMEEKGKSLSFITDGQRVPRDISREARRKLLLQLRGFRENPEQMIESLETKNTRMWS